jgi:hypothetical protein
LFDCDVVLTAALGDGSEYILSGKDATEFLKGMRANIVTGSQESPD